jgi:nitroimidazol reductase NimA-like FMN-containing flavoprotein (pyridoxamine 5'-phosphate oxidase superfamily)
LNSNLKAMEKKNKKESYNWNSVMLFGEKKTL